MPNPVKPEMITWARERAGMKPAELAGKFKRLSSWEDGSSLPTSMQLSEFAHAVHVPIGYLLREKPPVETFPIADFRSSGSGEGPSLALRDAVSACKRQQSWYRQHLHEAGQSKVGFVGSAKLHDDARDFAQKIASEFDLGVQRKKAETKQFGCSVQIA